MFRVDTDWDAIAFCHERRDCTADEIVEVLGVQLLGFYESWYF